VPLWKEGVRRDVESDRRQGGSVGDSGVAGTHGDDLPVLSHHLHKSSHTVESLSPASGGRAGVTHVCDGANSPHLPTYLDPHSYGDAHEYAYAHQHSDSYTHAHQYPASDVHADGHEKACATSDRHGDPYAGSKSYPLALPAAGLHLHAPQ
jgi:hypothetical protein